MVVAIVAENRNTEQGGFTAWGWFVWEAAGRRRIKSQKRIAELVSELGHHPISQPALSKNLTGKTEPSRKLHAAIAEAFRMDERERREFADVFAYTDNSQILTEENYLGMKEIQREAREEAERLAGRSEEIRGASGSEAEGK
jgi:hypothetical protein